MSNFMSSDRFYFSPEMLSLINEYSDSILVIKYGGSAMKDPAVKLNVIQDLCLLHVLGIKVVLVHGGGYLIDKWLLKLNIKPKFENGLRVTDLETMRVAEMVLTGQINQEIVYLLNQHYVSSVGLSGKDASLVKALPLFNSNDNFTGKISSVNTDILLTLLSNNFFPVVSSVAADSNGNTYNINADTLASSIASSLKASKLLLLTDTPGVLENLNDHSSLIKNLNLQKISELRSKNLITGGMIPKIECAVAALNDGVKSVHIVDGSLPHSLLYELLTCNRSGSMLVL
uniref:Acetylglutamate kinase n=1 Tax=Polysiphonia urceolata TaxID=173545 RepID=A0A1Z1MC88_POLUR|nr:acetylglutamate kinase [Polysiphonia stricta]ARW63596.1 acetylglutamate kinase [Polysiphonia stricta]